MQSIETIELLRHRRIVEHFQKRYDLVYRSYEERGWDTKKLRIEFPQEFRILRKTGTNVSKVEKLLIYYEGTLNLDGKNQ
jgi:predicted phage-related endonuclease